MVAVPPSDEEESFGRPAQRTTGPIVGVYSAVGETSLRTFMGQQSYDQWHFHVGLLPTPVLLGDNPAPRVHSGWVGKPFRKDLDVAGVEADRKRRRAIPEDVLGIRDRDRERRNREGSVRRNRNR